MADVNEPTPGDVAIHAVEDGQVIFKIAESGSVSLEYHGKDWTLVQAIAQACRIARIDGVRVWGVDEHGAYFLVDDFS